MVEGRSARRAVLDVRRDRLVGQVPDEVGLPVLPDPLREQSVEGGVERGVGHRADELGLDLGDVAERLDRLLALLRPPAPAGDHRAEHVAVAVLRDEGQRRGHLPAEERAELLGGLLDVVVVRAHDGAARPRPRRTSGRRRWSSTSCSCELEGGDDAEVPAAAAQRPEQVLVLVLARDEDPPIGGDHLRANQVVARQAAAAGEVADAAAQRQAGDAGGRDDAAGGGQAEGVGGVVEVAPGGAAAGARRARLGDPRTRVDPRRSRTTPPSQVPNPGALWPPPRTARSRPASRA